MTPARVQGGPRTKANGAAGGLVLEATKRRLVAALRAYFNFLVLNLALVVAMLPLVTAPLALTAAVVALERWREGGEDRVVKEFLSALRSFPPARATVATGLPLLVGAIACEEAHFFARGGTALDWLSLGSGVAALVVALTSTGYVLVLVARYPSGPLPDLWSLAVRLALQDLFVTGPLFVVEIAAAVLLGLLDPALALIGLPLGFLLLLRLTAEIGLRRAGIGFQRSVEAT